MTVVSVLLLQVEQEEIKRTKTLSEEQKRLISSLQAEVMRLSKDDAAIRRSDGVKASLSALEKKVLKLTDLYSQLEAAHEMLKTSNRVTHHQAAAAEAIVASASGDTKPLVAKLQEMEANLVATEKKLEAARGMAAKSRTDLENTAAALFKARGEAAAHKEELDGAMAMVESISVGFENMQEQNATVLKQLSDANDRLRALQMEKERLGTVVASADKEKLALEVAMEQKDVAIAALQQQVTLLDEARHKVQADLEARSEVFKKYSQMKQDHDTNLRDRAAAIEQRSAAVAALEDRAIKAEARVQELVKTNAEGDAARKRLDESIKVLNIKLDRAAAAAATAAAAAGAGDGAGVGGKKRGGKKRGSTADKLAKEYARFAKCPVCEARLRDRIILSCMHSLCNTCVDERIASRNRRCPICAQTFSANDVKQFH